MTNRLVKGRTSKLGVVDDIDFRYRGTEKNLLLHKNYGAVCIQQYFEIFGYSRGYT